MNTATRKGVATDPLHILFFTSLWKPMLSLSGGGGYPPAQRKVVVPENHIFGLCIHDNIGQSCGATTTLKVVMLDMLFAALGRGDSTGI